MGPALIALSFLDVHINSVNDASILCKNLLKFGPVTPVLTELM